ncbi:T9SS type A sorting domain-containing protein [Chryseobacterium viscerum]|uniref:T9SS C-terminal target domain-containing protein n=1 Tax=Chryseobacterium viscerum TaxID=1037377 RepID=A0A316WEM2_9FLAO|nr:T9SS type A sorting domain-containing protein [Chryseobacterium viscerum]PWN59881.1 T9SS C-terminal target domain-containing protein [Chryseobacterium viscerum]
MKLISIIFIVGTNICLGQTTITKSFNDPSVGDVINNYNINGTVDNSATGMNTTFNNSALTAGASSITNYATPTVSEIAAFPGSNIKMNNTGNTILYKSTASKLEITGAITADATLNFSADNGTFITYPASYGHSETDNARGTFSSSSGSGLFKGTVTTTADASGTLLIGTKTYMNVLRLKSVQNLNLYQSTDTSYLFSIGNVTSTTYLYYDNLHKFPLLNSTQGNITIPILSINQTTSNAQALDETFLAVNEQIKNDFFYVFPNPAEDFIIINSTKSRNYTAYKIYSMEGKMINSGKIEEGKIQISYLVPGMYAIEFLGNSLETKRIKILKK